MFLKEKGLSFKLNFFILLCSFLVFGTTLLLNYEISKQKMLDDIKENVKNLTFSVSNQIDKTILSAVNIADNFALTIENSNFTAKDLDKTMKAITKENDEIFGCGVAFEPNSFIKDSTSYLHHYYKSGNEILRLNANDSSYLNSPWYNRRKSSNAPGWSEPYNNNRLNIEQVSYAVPFYKLNGESKKFWGVATVDISLEWIQKLCASIKILKYGYAFLLTSKGNYISHPFKTNGSNEDIFTIAKKYNDSQYIDIGKIMMKGDTGIVLYKNSTNNYNGWIFHAPSLQTNWFLGVFLPEDELFADLNHLNIILVSLGAVGLIILLIIIIIISKKLTKPLKELALATEDIGTGNFKVVINQMNTNDEIGVLSRSFISMQSELKEYIKNLEISTSAKERVESELKIAREIQQRIVPHKFPAFPDRNEFDLHAILEPAREVGGDLYDYFLIDSNHLCGAIGDVSGKGVPAALITVATQMLFRSKADKFPPINKIIEGMNDILYQNNNSEMFVTFFLFILDLKNGDFEYFNAGHTPPYIIRKNCKIEKLEEIHSPPLGIMLPEFNKSSKVKINSGDKIILYTDGVTEAHDTLFELYGEKRLENEIKNLENQTPKDAVEIILDSIKNFTKDVEQFDDIAILVVKYF